MAGLPITSHDWHGEWNYTLLPAWPKATPDPATTAPSTRRDDRDDRAWRAHPALTGLARREWDRLIDRLALLRHDPREADLHRQRGGPRKVAAETGRHPRLALPERLLITVLHQRPGLPQVTLMTANRAIRQIQPLLDRAGYTITPTQKRLHPASDLTAYALSTGAFPQEINSAG